MKSLINADDGGVLLEQVELADTFFRRLVGLQFRHSLARDRCLWLTPCSSLHTCFMRFPIDIFMLDTNDVVIAIRRNVRPWRAVIGVPGTVSVIETYAGAIEIKLATRLATLSR